MRLELVLLREPACGSATPGKLYLNGQFFCYTLEDMVREVRMLDGSLAPVASWKVAKQTAIPSGLFVVRVTFSGRFQRLLPLVDGVPGFSGVRMHGGNTDKDTEGCPLVGLHRSDKDLSKIWNCAPAVLSLTQAVAKAEEGDGTTLKVVNDQALADAIRAHALGVKLT